MNNSLLTALQGGTAHNSCETQGVPLIRVYVNGVYGDVQCTASKTIHGSPDFYYSHLRNGKTEGHKERRDKKR